MKKAKLAWREIYKPKEEGGLGIRSIKEDNHVCCMKLIWRIISFQPTLWVKWIQRTYLHRCSFWIVKETTNRGSWMLKKMLKYRDKAKAFVWVDVSYGQKTSFLFDNWSQLGRIYDLTGSRGYIDLGISEQATVAFVVTNRRIQNHMIQVLNDIVNEIRKLQHMSKTGEDIFLWKTEVDRFSEKFNTKRTWYLMRTNQARTDWYRRVWFNYATQKFAFLTWLAHHNILSTWTEWAAGTWGL